MVDEAGSSINLFQDIGGMYMTISNDMWKLVQAHLGYNDEEMELFKKNPKSEVIVSKVPKLMNLNFIFEVVQAHGCVSQHKVGDKIYFDGLASLIPEASPNRICAYAISSMSQLIWTAQELVYAGVDPNNMCYDRVCCIDVGVRCGGVGNVAFSFKAEKKGSIA
jgi:uncharacterized repeat protein (TIGR04076 family)